MNEYRLYMEYIAGVTVKQFLWNIYNRESQSGYDMKSCETVSKCIGQLIAMMHDAEVVHGDLTTSNMLLKSSESSIEEPKIYLIDFGLGNMRPSIEDKAVDLYVLERAFLSTHPGSEILV